MPDVPPRGTESVGPGGLRDGSGREQVAAARGCRPLAPCTLLALCLLLLGSVARADSPAKFDSPPPSNHVLHLPVVLNRASGPKPYRTYLPQIQGSGASIACPTESTRQWGKMATHVRQVSGASQSPDLNLSIRGWYRVNENPGFVKYDYPDDEPPDSLYPLYLSNVVSGGSASAFVTTYQISDWDWIGCNCAVPRDPSPYPVTMLGLRTTPAQEVRIPRRGQVVDPQGFIAMVLYADAMQLAVAYLWDDRVDAGYLVHLVNLCVDPNLVALYQQLDAAGRLELPGVYADSIVGLARNSEVDVVVRDSGSFMDPRSRQDWWQDRPE